MPAVYCCGSCGQVVGDSLSVIGGVKTPALKNALNVVWTGTPSISHEHASSLYCKFFCKKCEVQLGKIFRCTNEAYDNLRGLFLLDEGAYTMYELGSSTVSSNDEEYLMEEDNGTPAPASASVASSSSLPAPQNGPSTDEKILETRILLLQCFTKVEALTDEVKDRATFEEVKELSVLYENLKTLVTDLYSKVLLMTSANASVMSPSKQNLENHERELKQQEQTHTEKYDKTHSEEDENAGNGVGGGDGDGDEDATKAADIDVDIGVDKEEIDELAEFLESPTKPHPNMFQTPNPNNNNTHSKKKKKNKNKGKITTKNNETIEREEYGTPSKAKKARY